MSRELSKKQSANPFPAVFWLLALAVALILGVGTFLDAERPESARLQSVEANFAYSWLHSGYFDKDFDFENEFRVIINGAAPSTTRAYFLEYLNSGPRTDFDSPMNPGGITPGLLSLPFYIALDKSLPLIFKDSGRISSFSNIFPMSYALLGILFGFFGIALSYRVLTSAFSPATSFATLFILSFGTPLFSLIRFDPGNPSLFSFFLSAVFTLAASSLAAALSDFDLRGRAFGLVVGAVSTGLFLGILCSARPLNILFILLPFALTNRVLGDSGGKRRYVLSFGALGLYLLFLSGFVLGIAPQLLAWKTHAGSLYSLKSAIPNFSIKIDAILNALLLPPYGLLFTSPITAVGLFGLIIGFLRGRTLPSCGILIAFLGLGIYASIADPVALTGYGLKCSAEYGLLLAVGIAEILDLISSRLGKALAFTIGLFLCIPNLASAFAARQGIELQAETATKMLFIRQEDLIQQGLKDFNLLGVLGGAKLPLVEAAQTTVEP